MKYCANCGNQLDDNVKFCPVCGCKQPEQVQGISGDNKKTVNHNIEPDKIFSDDMENSDNLKKENTHGNKTVLDIFKITLKIAGVCVIAFFIFAMVITAYTESQLDKLAEYVEECNYDEAEEIAEKLSGGVFQLFLGGDMLTSFTESNNQTYGEQYICEAFSEYKDGYLDNSYIPLDATFYYQNKDFSELEDKYGQVGQNSEIDAQIDEIVEGLEKADATYHDYINKKNLFAEPDCFVLIVEYENYAGDISEYAVFTYDVYDDAFVLFDTCNTLDENAGVLQKWLSYCLYNELYNTDYNRLQEMINNGAFSNK